MKIWCKIQVIIHPLDKDFVDYVDLDKDLIISMVEDLKASCRNYIYFRVPEDFKDIIQDA